MPSTAPAIATLRGMAAVVRRHPVTAFVVLTFVVSWVIWGWMAASRTSIATPSGTALNLVAAFTPSVAGLVVAWILGRPAGQDLLAGLSLRRLGLGSAAIAIALPFVMIAVAIGISVAVMGGTVPVLSIAVVGTIAAEWLRVIVVGGPLGEEIGWRGFVLPRLLRDGGAMRASVLLGVVWGLWHVPLYFVPGTGQLETAAQAGLPFSVGAFVVWTIGLSIVFTWLFLRSGGSVLAAILLHASVNTASFVPSAVGSTGAASLLYALVTWLVALGMSRRLPRLSSSPAGDTVTQEAAAAPAR